MGRRLQSVDILRGATVAGMILVNNGHSGSFEALRHAQWNGLTLCDLVFPFFLFIMGVSMYLSFSSTGFRLSQTMFIKILRRTVLLLFLGLALNWFDKAISGDVLCFDTLRYWAVLQRIALCYFIVAMIVFATRSRATLWIAAGLLVVYGVVLVAGHGYAHDSNINVLARADVAIFGYEHLYHKSPVDPEGLLGTICSVVNVLLGFYCGRLLKEQPDMQRKLTSVLLFGAVVLMAGYLVSLGFPLNKRVWSPSFAMVTSGWCALLLGLIMRLVDGDEVRGYTAVRPVLDFFKVFGVNALFLYVFSEVLAVLCGHFGLSDMWFGLLESLIMIPQLVSLCYALSFVLVCYGAGYILKKRNIYIKL